MKITGFEILTIEIPMRMSVKHALAERSVARNILCAAHGENGQTGWGESCPRPYVTGETIESVKADLCETILPRLAGVEINSFEDATETLIEAFEPIRRNQQAAFCAAELSILDLIGRSTGCSAGEVIGPIVHDTVYYSGVIATEEPEAVMKQCTMMKQFGARFIKVKVSADLKSNLAILSIARNVLGDDVPLRVDANAAWSGAEAIRQLDAMQAFDLVGVEQPVPGDDLEGMKQVTAAGLVPVVADESLSSVADAQTLVLERACDIFNLRVSKCGGMINCGRLHQIAAEAGLQCQLGAQVGETGILSAAGRHLATRLADLLWFEGSYGGILLEQVITEPDVTVTPGGVGPALQTPGLGVAPMIEALAGVETERIEFKPSSVT